MKRVKAFTLSVVLCVTAVLSYYTCCKASVGEKNDSSEMKSDILVDFEHPKTTLKQVRLSGINKAKMCNDKKYVTEGKNCLHLCPEDENISEGQYYANDSIQLYPKKTTFKDVEYISIDIYNPTDFERKVIFYSEEYTIKPGHNTLWRYIDRARLDYTSQGVIQDFSLTFEGGSHDMGPLDVYVDNFRCYYSDIEYQAYTNDFSQNVWYSFEQTGDLANLIYMGTRLSVFSGPVYSINRDIRYIKSGTGSLKVDFRNTNTGAQDVRAFRTLDNKLGSLNQYLDNLSGYYLGFPVYNPNDTQISLSVTVFSNYQDEQVSISTIVEPNSWSSDDFILSLQTIKDKFTGEGLDVLTIVFSVSGLPQGGTIYLDSIGVYPVE